MSRSDVQLPVVPGLTKKGFGKTSRSDGWWIQPLLVFLGFMGFIVYSTWAAFQGVHYHFDGNGAQYLSPFYSPELFGSSEHSVFGPKPGWWPQWMPFSPAFLILWAPGGFRFTCYYYRGAYYKAFWADPPNCGVSEPRKGYRGEHTFPLVLQNIHRYFWYLAVVFIVILSYDAIKGFFFHTDEGVRFGIRVGSLVLLMNAILLGGYTFGCHSARHILGGGLDLIAGRPVRKKAYECVSCLNRGHMKWAWFSLFWVGFSDFYVRMCSMGHLSDLKIL